MSVDNAVADAAAPAGCGPKDEAVRRQLGQICSSCDFAKSERLRRFLRFIVEETLQGRGARLKAYTVALGAFDRDESFDPQADPIVRIEAGRLRRALERYYLTDGCDDPVLITVPKGSYVPRFAWHAAEASPGEALLPEGPQPVPDVRQAGIGKSVWGAAWAVVLALAGSVLALVGRETAPVPAAPFLLVVPFTAVADAADRSPGATGLTSSLIETLANRVRVMGYETIRLAQPELSMPVLRHDYGLSHVLEGDLMSQGGLVTVSVRLVDAGTKSVIWATRYERVRPDAIATLRSDIADKVLSALGQEQDATGVPGMPSPTQQSPPAAGIGAKVLLAPVAALAGSPGR